MSSKNADKIKRAKIVLKILNKTYPTTPIPLKHRNIFTLLISVLLSAQCTDVNVNNVTKNIYPKYNKPEHFVKLGRKKIERLIKSIGLFRNKAKSVYFLSKQLIDKHGGKVPKNFEDLEIKALVVEGQLLDGSQIDILAKLPSKEEAYGLIANVLQAPVGKFATLLNEVPSKLARVLTAVRDNKEASA